MQDPDDKMLAEGESMKDIEQDDDMDGQITYDSQVDEMLLEEAQALKLRDSPIKKVKSKKSCKKSQKKNSSSKP